MKEETFPRDLAMMSSAPRRIARGCAANKDRDKVIIARSETRLAAPSLKRDKDKRDIGKKKETERKNDREQNASRARAYNLSAIYARVLA